MATFLKPLKPESVIRRIFDDVFGFGPKKPITLGMIHMSGCSITDRINRASKELDLLVEYGVTGCVFENYHCHVNQLLECLSKLPLDQWRGKIKFGLNILPNEYELALEVATKYGMDFIQLDYVSGSYFDNSVRLNEASYLEVRSKYPTIIVLGGVHPKYYTPSRGSVLEDDLRNAMQLADAIVVTGSGTGKETPMAKIEEFRRIIGPSFPLIVGAGVTPSNAVEQLALAQGMIVGSSLKKDNNTQQLMEPDRIFHLQYKLGCLPSKQTYVRIDGETVTEGSVSLTKRLDDARCAAIEANFPSYLVKATLEMIERKESFVFPWYCNLCSMANSRSICTCGVCGEDNPNYDETLAAEILVKNRDPNTSSF